MNGLLYCVHCDHVIVTQTKCLRDFYFEMKLCGALLSGSNAVTQWLLTNHTPNHFILNLFLEPLS